MYFACDKSYNMGYFRTSSIRCSSSIFMKSDKSYYYRKNHGLEIRKISSANNRKMTVR